MNRLRILIISIISGGIFLLPSILFAQSIDSISMEIQKLISSSSVEQQRDFTKNLADSVLVTNSLSDAKNYFRSKPELALKLIMEALDLSIKSKSLHHISLSLEQLGNFYFQNENYDKATPCYLNSLQIEEKLGNEKRIADLNDELGTIYFYQEIFEKSLDYHKKALNIYQNINDILGQAKALSHLGSLHSSREYCEKRTEEQIKTDQQTALEFYDRSMNFYEKMQFQAGIVHLWGNIGNAYRRMGQPEKALSFLEKALEYYRQTNDVEHNVQTLRTIALTYNQLEKYDLALAYLKEAEEIAAMENITDGIQFLYETISQTYDNLKDYKNARDYYVKYMILRDSIYNNEKSHQIIELETKYQTEKKQSEIEKLTLFKKQRTLVNYILIAVLLLLVLFSYTYFRNIRNKKIIADQQLEIKEKQLLEMEKEHQLNAARSVLKGEEIERRRFARDLHDGLGGMLSGLKINLSTMKGNSIITAEQSTAFENALNLIDKSIFELRRVAHNLMPETLNHYGLKTALSDFIAQLNQQISTKINFSFFGDDQRYEPQLELTVFRIAQELVNNALKHAEAQQIMVLLFAEKNRVCLQVNDNGLGFIVNSGPLKSGGLAGISNRVEALNGKLDIDSAPGKGTEIAVEFFIS